MKRPSDSRLKNLAAEKTSLNLRSELLNLSRQSVNARFVVLAVFLCVFWRRLRSHPAVSGDVDHHRVGSFVLLFEEARRRRLRTAEAVFRARLVQATPGVLNVVNPKAEVVQPKHGSKSILAVRSLDSFEAQHRHVDCAIAQIHALGDG